MKARSQKEKKKMFVGSKVISQSLFYFLKTQDMVEEE